VNDAIDNSMLAPMPSDQMPNIHCRIPRHLLTNPQRVPSLKLIEQEVHDSYLHSLRKGIGKCPVRHPAALSPIIQLNIYTRIFQLPADGSTQTDGERQSTIANKRTKSHKNHRSFLILNTLRHDEIYCAFKN